MLGGWGVCVQWGATVLGSGGPGTNTGGGGGTGVFVGTPAEVALIRMSTDGR